MVSRNQFVHHHQIENDRPKDRPSDHQKDHKKGEKADVESISFFCRWIDSNDSIATKMIQSRATRSDKPTLVNIGGSLDPSCQQLYRYVANMDQKFITDNDLGDIFVKNFEMTKYCDHLCNFEQERDQLIHQINKNDDNRYSRLISSKRQVEENDARIATQAFEQNFGKIRQMMIQTMPFYHRFSFNCVDWWKRNQCFFNKIY